MTDVAPPGATATSTAADASGDGAPSPSPPAYRPHKMERYYAQHLLQTHFSASNNPTAPADFSHVATAPLTDSTPHSIHVPGRTAVPFLTTSGVPRDVLKQIWNVVDPDGLGTLIRRSQFHAMLRLVALEEAGLLPPLEPSAEAGAAAGEILTDALTKYSHLEITLPTFDAVQMPSAAFLVGTYSDAVRGQDEAQVETHHVWEQQQQPTSLMSAQYQQEQRAGVGMMAGGMGMGMAGGMGMGMAGGVMSPMGTAGGMPMQQPQQMMSNNASYHSQPSGSGSGSAMMSVGDAFADLGPSEDRVLPSDDFGDFAEADEEAVVVEEEEEEEVQQEEAVVEVDAAAATNNFVANDVIEEANVPVDVEGQDQTLPTAAAAAVPSQMDVLGGNDGLLGAPLPPQPPSMGMDMGMDGMGAPPPLPTGPPPPQPPPPVSGAEHHEEEGGEEGSDDEDDDGFGDFEGMDNDDEAPVATDNVEALATTTSSTAGDFITSDLGAAATMPPAMPPPLEVPSEPSVPDVKGGAAAGFASSGGGGMGEFGAGINAFGDQTVADPLSVSDAFAALGPSSDAPLSAEPFGAAEPQATDGTEDQEEEDDDDDDDDDGFGDFGAADGAGHGDTTSPDEAPLEAANGDANVAAQTSAEPDDSFGGFEDHSQLPPPTTSATEEETSDDPFAALGPEDAPLPADPFNSAGQVADTANGDNNDNDDDDDDFGTFETVQAPVAEKDIPVPPSEPSSDAAAPLSDVPPPPPPTDVQEEAAMPAPAEDAFAALGPAEDTPLPILSIDTTETSPSAEPIDDITDLAAAAEDGDDDDDDDFGSFEEVDADEAKEPATDVANKVEDTQIVPTIDTNDTMNPPMHVPPPFPAQKAASEAPSDDPFAVLGASQDAPLPVLSYGSTEAEATPTSGADDSDNDDFGEFEEIPGSDLPPADLEVQPPEDGLASEIIDETTPAALTGKESTSAAVDTPQLPIVETAEDVAPQVFDASEPPPPEQVQDTPSDDPFSVLGPAADAPLPVLSFGSATSAAAGTLADALGAVTGDENDDKDNDEDFGAFETNPSVEGMGMTAENMVAEGPTEAALVTTEDKCDDDGGGDDDDDNFGDFDGGNASENEVPIPTDGEEISAVQETPSSDFGLFGPPVGESTPSLQETNTTDTGAFGVFGPPSDAPTPGLSDPVQSVDTFDAFSPNNEAPASSVSIEATGETPANNNIDAFASTDARPVSISKAAPADNDSQDDDDDFGAFADTQVPAQTDATNDFGQFDDAAVTHDAPAEMPETEGFGDFSDFPAPAAATEAEDQFNAFASNEPTAAQPIPGQESEFDAFGSAPSPQGENLTPSAPVDDGGDDDEDFGEWGAFGEGDQTAAASSFPDEMSAIEEIKNKVSASGGALDDVHFGDLSILECINNGANGDVRLATRSFFIYHLLSSTHMGNATVWPKLIEATKIELATCKSLLQEMAKSLTRKDRVAVSKSDQLRVFLEGLREYVRVVRSISASMADLQCLPDDIDLSNLNGWRTSSLLEEAFVVETQWSQMLRAVKKLGIKVDLKLETIPEMRKRTSNLHVDHNDADSYAKMVCSLTLQPLADTVEWGGHSYTAGAANLYANKVSAVAPLQ